MLKRQVLPLLSLTLLGTSVLLPYSAKSNVLAQAESNHGGWQQPYTSTRLEWLFTNLAANRTVMNCVGKNVDENGLLRWVTFYHWSRSTNDLRLVVNSSPDDLSYCTSVAFEELRYKSFQMGFSPPRIELLHYLNDENGNQIIDEPITYTCYVPVKTNQSDYNTGQFEDNCRMNTAQYPQSMEYVQRSLVMAQSVNSQASGELILRKLARRSATTYSFTPVQVSSPDNRHLISLGSR